jgi:uncharacterized protein (DUF1684 family)
VTTSLETELETAWRRWHTVREQELATDYGWLSITGFHWLPTKFQPLPGVPGQWQASATGAALRADPGEGLAFASGPREGEQVEGVTSASVPEAGSLLWVRFDGIVVELVLRGGRYAIRRRDPRAPERAAFDGVPAFAVDPSWVRPGRFTAYPEPTSITVETARNDLRQQVRTVGTVDIDIAGQHHSLIATAGQSGRLNLSFRDTTNGDQTAPWRVVTTSIPTETGALVVDFNRAVNLPFSFTEFGTCPAPVVGNQLPVAVTAGEKSPTRVTGGTAASIHGQRG